jgi:uncharacterized membrane protein YraQ (UPF0718 family)
MFAKSNITMLYENLDSVDGNFHTNYYVSQPMLLAKRAWRTWGIRGWQIVMFLLVSGVKPIYLAAAVVTFSSLEGANESVYSSNGHEAGFWRYSNFTNLKPIPMLGEGHGSWTKGWFRVKRSCHSLLKTRYHSLQDRVFDWIYNGLLKYWQQYSHYVLLL